MKNNKIIVALATVFTAVMCATGSVKAAPVQMPDGNVFDAEFYAATYPDVVAAFGTDPNLLYMHYITCGAAEGRLPYGDATVTAVTVTLGDNYAAKRIDAFSSLVVGSTVYEDYKVTEQSSAYTRIDNGYRWRRLGGRVNTYTDESALFDAASYALLNPDVAAEYGYSKDALWNHYKTTGVYEGRPVCTTTARSNAKLAVIQVAQSIITPDLNTEQKIRAVHDWMCLNCCYDYNFANVSHYMDGFMTNGTAVCSGYAETFEYFMYVLDIPCQTIWGGNHAWNIVCVDGQWLCIDVCWDDPYKSRNDSRISYKYYLISQDQMCRDHCVGSFKDFF